MKRSIASKMLLVAFAFAVDAESAPRASSRAVANPDPVEQLVSQERRMWQLARDFGRRCELAMEEWIAQGETSEAKLFSFLYYPIEATNPPKFSTEWDKLADRDIRPIEDDILSKSAALIFTVMVDRHGYLPAHNTRYSQPLTGNLAVDLVNNRTKRIFADKTGLAAARNTEPYLIQKYQRDTGEKMEDLSVPIFVRGKKWGSVRLGYRVVDEP